MLGGSGGGERTPSKLETRESGVTMRGSDAQLRWGHDEFEAHLGHGGRNLFRHLVKGLSLEDGVLSKRSHYLSLSELVVMVWSV